MAEKKKKKAISGTVVKTDVALAEEKILKFWKEKNIFEKTLKKPAPNGNFVFYDGPPFATGLPHFGHILASAIKDAVPRYQTMKGKCVERRWGWDCHGLPIENIVEKDLKISGKKEIEALGIEKFNEYARSKVLEFVSRWKDTIERIGRWVDFDGSYKTMDNAFIESVWWALKEINNKKLVYESVRVLPYCPRCETPIANSEIAMDESYKDITDISVYVKLELLDEPKTFLLAWTTTPWTLPGNTAAAVHPDIDYVKVKIANEFFVLAKERLSILKDKPYKIIGEFKGAKLIGKKYHPFFDYFAKKNLPNKENGWKIYAAPYVTTESGTGIVHLAPAYGEEDMELAQKYNIPFVFHVGPDGKFTQDAKDFAGLYAKSKESHQSSDILIIKNLAHRGILFAKEKIVHSYPHCFRCETPLYYFAIPAWFIKISEFKKRLIDLNEKIHWIPEHLKYGRFKKGMENAPDWNISRNRYWASPLPIWKCNQCGEVEFIGSVDALKERAKTKNRYFLIRHGEANSNVLNIASSKMDTSNKLTAKGRGQILASAEELKKEKIDVIYASDFIRTKETAEILARELGFSKDKIKYDHHFREYNAGVYDGKNWNEYYALFSSTAERFDKAPPEGESLMDLRQRVIEGINALEKKEKGKRILIVSHGDPLFFIEHGVKGLSKDALIDEFVNCKTYLKTGECRVIDFIPLPLNSRGELDLHRPYIDAINFPCKCGKGEMKRIVEVIDCWFESASMPFAADHYPFENKKKFEKNFPAQFVAEYIAQTRTWFYYSHVLATVLFGEIPFEHVVTTGTILTEDGQKMSKSKSNFPDPWLIFNKYGVDALRFYMLASPLMKSEDLNFSEKGVDEIYKKIILRLRNVNSFYKMYREGFSPDKKTKSDHILDRWILLKLHALIRDVELSMDRFEIDKALSPIGVFIEELSTWYIRRSRDRFKNDDLKNKTAALATTEAVLTELSKIIAPFMPFIAEEIYKDVSASPKESVHLENWPEMDTHAIKDIILVQNMKETRRIIGLGLEQRAKAGIKVRQPLPFLKAKGLLLQGKEEFVALIKDEMNVKDVIFDSSLAEDVFLDLKITPELQAEGDIRELVRNIQELRKKTGLIPSDKIIVSIEANDAGESLLQIYEKEMKATCGIVKIEVKPYGGSNNFGKIKLAQSE